MNTLDFNSDISPQMIDIDSDGDLDLFIGQDYNTSTFPIRGRIYFFRNIGNSNEDIFELEDDEFLGTDIGNSLTPSFADIDSDGDLDLFIGHYNGSILFYRNIGTSNSMNFIYESDLQGVESVTYSSPTFVDIDSDGDLDLFIGSNLGTLYFYQNIGSPSNHIYELITDNFFSIDIGSRSHPTFIDYDLDNDYDLIMGSNNQNITIYQNLGDNFSANYVEADCINIPYYGMNTKPDFYIKNNLIYSLTGLSTGGLLHSKLNSYLGDVNLDNVINVLDAVIIVNHIVEDSVASFCLSYADMNVDGFVNILDIVLLISQIVD